MADDREVRPERFLQPIEDIEIVSRAPKPRTLLTQEQVEKALDRIEQGESVETVAEDLAVQKTLEEFNFLEGLVED